MNREFPSPDQESNGIPSQQCPRVKGPIDSKRLSEVAMDGRDGLGLPTQALGLVSTFFVAPKSNLKSPARCNV
jgi:hypothetical protein